MNTTTQKNDFNAPTVPVADPMDGLLQVKHLSNPIGVDIRIWNGMRAGYFMQLLLNGDLIGPVWTMSDTDKPGDVVSMAIEPSHLLDEGHYTLGYRATNDKSLLHNDSETIPLIVDRSPPGGPLLAPVMLASACFGEFLKARISGYTGLTAGDMIQTVCNGTHGPAYRIHPENLTTLPIEIAFTREFLEGLFSDKVNITYHVTDRAGNRSILAQSVELTLQR
jgi:hypothetical protein